MKRIEIAYHEAGHLVADIIFKLNATSATIIKDGDFLGSVSRNNRLRPDYTEDELKNVLIHRKRLKRVLIFDPYDSDDGRMRDIAKKEIISLLAGYFAQKKYNPSANKIHSEDDFTHAYSYLDHVFRVPLKYYDKDNILNLGRFLNARFVPQAEKFVDEHWKEISFTANYLMKHKTIMQEDLDYLRSMYISLRTESDGLL